MANAAIKWAAQVAHVREVSLLGTADLAYWAERLRREDLLADERDGKAQVMIVGAALRWRGVRFRELSVSVVVRTGAGGAERRGAYLLHAWNSSRFFAACERVFFSTPYAYGNVRISTAGPASIQLVRDGEIVFRAEGRADRSTGAAGEPARPVRGGWSGPVFLPGDAAAPAARRRLFFARVEGSTETYPFRPDEDTLMMRPSGSFNAIAALVDSRFVPETWTVRPDAMHAKSKTYGRNAAPF